MPRTLITGIAGFTGRYLAATLALRGHEIIGLNKVASSPIDHVDNICGVDMLDAAGLEEAIAKSRADHLIHLAGIAQVNHGDVDALYRTNILGSRNLLEAIKKAPVKPKSVLIASSANVYGNRRGGKIGEDVLPVPANDYGVTKLAVENLARIYGEVVPIIVARPFNYTGRGQNTAFLIPKIIEHARRRDNSLSLGNMDVARDFSDVRMVVEAYARLILAPRAIGKTVNVCSERATSLREVIDLVERVSGHRFDIKVDPALVRNNEVHMLIGDNSLLKSLIGELTVPTLSETIRWMLG